MNRHSQTDDEALVSHIGHDYAKNKGDGWIENYGGANGTGVGFGDSSYGDGDGYGCGKGNPFGAIYSNGYGDGTSNGNADGNGEDPGLRRNIPLTTNDPDLWIVWTAEQDLG